MCPGGGSVGLFESNFKQTFFSSQLTDSSLLSVVHEARGLMGKSQRSCDSYVQVEKH